MLDNASESVTEADPDSVMSFDVVSVISDGDR